MTKPPDGKKSKPNRSALARVEPRSVATIPGTAIVPLEVYHLPPTRSRLDGPWGAEPDKVSWIDAATGLPCIVRRADNGALCGYVGVGPAHPLYGFTTEPCRTILRCRCMAG